MVLTFEIVDELLKCDDLDQYFPAVLFIFQKFLTLSVNLSRKMLNWYF